MGMVRENRREGSLAELVSRFLLPPRASSVRFYERGEKTSGKRNEGDPGTHIFSPYYPIHIRINIYFQDSRSRGHCGGLALGLSSLLFVALKKKKISRILFVDFFLLYQNCDLTS